jgi:peroxiredoxin
MCRVWIALGLLSILAPGQVSSEDIRPVAGHRAPDFALHDLKAKTVRLSDFLGKKAVLVNFWATWCVPCREEMPTMERAYREYKAKGLEILAVSADAGPEAAARKSVAQFMNELKLSFPAVLDYEMEVAQLYRVVGIPATFLIDRRGVIRAVEVGPRDWFSPGSRKQLEELLR